MRNARQTGGSSCPHDTGYSTRTISSSPTSKPFIAYRRPSAPPGRRRSRRHCSKDWPRPLTSSCWRVPSIGNASWHRFNARAFPCRYQWKAFAWANSCGGSEKAGPALHCGERGPATTEPRCHKPPQRVGRRRAPEPPRQRGSCRKPGSRPASSQSDVPITRCCFPWSREDAGPSFRRAARPGAER